MALEVHIPHDAPLQQDFVRQCRYAEAGMQLAGHGTAADLAARFEHDWLHARPGEIEGRDQAVVAAADDDGSHQESGVRR